MLMNMHRHLIDYPDGDKQDEIFPEFLEKSVTADHIWNAHPPKVRMHISSQTKSILLLKELLDDICSKPPVGNI